MSVNDSPNMAACPEFEQDLVLFHYKELDNPERLKLESHIKNCGACAHSLTALNDLLPRTLLDDEPPAAFWNDYSRELRHKLAQLGEREPWWRRWFLSSQPWAMPALATSAVVA